MRWVRFTWQLGCYFPGPDGQAGLGTSKSSSAEPAKANPKPTRAKEHDWVDEFDLNFGDREDRSLDDDEDDILGMLSKLVDTVSHTISLGLLQTN
jgi:hypothetical protein